MDDFIVLLVFFFLVAVLCGIVLPIVAIVQTRNTRREFLERIERLEGALLHPSAQPAETLEPPIEESAPWLATPVEAPSAPPQPMFSPAPSIVRRTEHLESVIGRRWLGWAAIVLILFALAFFLKYAFENRWVGEVGRVAIGIAAGISLSFAGLHYHRRGWRVFSQMMTAGGIMLLYLSAYGAFGFYHLIDQSAAFPFLGILIAEAAALAYFYNAPAIAMMALVGGFLAPVLLRSDRDHYRELFGYITALDLGAMALLRHWVGLSSLAYLGAHALFWSWYDANYHPYKRPAVLAFQSAVFLIFFGAHVGRQLIGKHTASLEDLGLLFVNPFVFFATSYQLLDRDHHEWMGVLAIVLASLYAGAARLMLAKVNDNRGQMLLIIATALTFVTLAIPIQLRSNWITIAWAVEGVLMIRVAFATMSLNLRAMGLVVLGLSLFKMVFWDTPFEDRGLFTPVLNRYFLSSMAVSLSVFATAELYRRFKSGISKDRGGLTLVMIGVVAIWFVLTVETHTYFQAQGYAVKDLEAERQLWWLGKMAVSILWSVYAAVLAAVGFIRRVPGIRWAALVLFTVTAIKVVFMDMAELKQFYRIIAFLVLGLVLLAVAWGYQRAFQTREPQQ